MINIKKFKDWLPTSRWNLIITSKRLDTVYMRDLNHRKANYCFNLEKEKLCIIKGNLSYGDLTVFNRFDNDFKEMYYGKRPKDRDFVAEKLDEMKEFTEKMGLKF